MALPTAPKAKKMLKHGSAQGKSLTSKQRKLFQSVASGWKSDNPFRKLREKY